MITAAKNIQSSKPHILPTQVPIEKAAEQAGEQRDTISINLSSVGSALQKGARFVAGSATAALALPRTIFAPAVASVGTGKTREVAEFVGWIGSGAAATATAGFMVGGPVGIFVGAVLGGVGSLFAGAAKSSFVPEGQRTLLNYESIDKARAEARENADGSSARKSGAAFKAGFAAALKESYEGGASLVDKTGKVLSQGADFMGGVIKG